MREQVSITADLKENSKTGEVWSVKISYKYYIIMLHFDLEE